ncbi:MAG TPA: energy-coupling factor transporter transmembrane component T [Candidatus Eisenbacteria bacterium]|nr:energy-coupling factor transporter transmembrane component T [Candidatus Eisenbacteria bacterium]
MSDARASRAAVAPLLIGTLIGSLVAGRLETGALCLALAAGAAIAMRAPWPNRRWRVTLLISVVLGIVVNLYLIPGRPLAAGPSIAGHAPTREGLELGALLMMRLLGAMASLQGLRAAWPGERSADQLASWLVPLERLRVPVRELRTVVGLALRFAPLMGGEARRIARVQDLRAGRAPRGAGEWWQRRRAAAVPILVSSLERAERVALALEARGYRTRPLDLTPGLGHPTAWGVAGIAVAGAALLWRG